MKNSITYPHLDQLIINRGIEKEALRINIDGSPATTRHPTGLGSALKNPFITTDFAECLPEIITGIHQDTDALLTELSHINAYLVQHLPDNERLWPASMPPYISDPDSIMIADYGTSHMGYLKRLYRIGLSHRYNKVMQIIAGIHYNVSFTPAVFDALEHRDNLVFQSQHERQSHYYMHTLRQFLHYQWLLVLLYGASPVAMSSSLHSADHNLNQFNTRTHYAPLSTSLRLSPLGYQNSAQEQLRIRYDSVSNYATDLYRLTTTECQQYSQIRAIPEHHPLQINRHTLQIENELYSSIRPKPKARPNERPSLSLLKNGIEYLEIRLFDLNPLCPLGITKDQIHVTDTLITHCLMKADNHAPLSTSDNLKTVISHGLDSSSTIDYDNQILPIHIAAQNLLAELKHTAHWMDNHTEAPVYEQAIENAISTLASPSGSINNTLIDELDHYETNMLERASQFYHYFKTLEIPKEHTRKMQTIAKESIQQQVDQESFDSKTSFESFFEKYEQHSSFDHYLLNTETSS